MNERYIKNLSKTNQNIYTNVKELTDHRFFATKARHYTIISIVDIFHNLVKETLRKECDIAMGYNHPEESHYSEKTFLEILETTERSSLNSFDVIIFDMVTLFPELRNVTNNEINIPKISKSIYDVVNTDKNEKSLNSFRSDLSSLNSIDDFLTIFNEAIPTSSDPKLNAIYGQIIGLAFDSENPYAKSNFDSFSEIYKKDSDSEFAKEWFFKNPRSGDASLSGFLDMAYQSTITNSILFSAFMDNTKENA